MRFDQRIRLLGSFLFCLTTIIWLPIVIYVPALAFNQVSGIDIHVITPAVCMVCIFYTCVGGLKAVVWTDVIQSFVMFGSIILVIIKGTLGVGGLGEVIRRNFETGRLETPAITLDPTERCSIFSVIIGGMLFHLQVGICNQVIMQRFLAVPDLKAAGKALILYSAGVFILLGCCGYNGLLIFAKYYKCDPLSTKLAKAKDQLVPLLVMDVLGGYPGLSGLFVAGVFSAALSSLSTGLNSLSAIFLEDFVKPHVKKPLTEKQTAIFLRSVVVVIGVISVALVYVVEKLGMVLQLSMTMSSVSNGPLFGIFVMGVLCPWLNSKNALIGGLSGFAVMAWIGGNAQIAIASGALKFPTKPVSTEECLYSFDNTTIPTFTPKVEKSLYHISFLYYIALGSVISLIIAHLSMLFVGRMNLDEVDPKLLAPFIRKFMKSSGKRSSSQSDMKEMETFLHSANIENKQPKLAQ